MGWSLAVLLVEMLGGNHTFVELMGWQKIDWKSRQHLPQRAREVMAVFAADKIDPDAIARKVFGSCVEMPPPCIVKLFGEMVELTPAHRVSAECAATRIRDES